VVQVKKKFVQQAILDSAHDLFSQKGYHDTTLQEIADLAGVGVSSLYSYFPSKLHLLSKVEEPWYKESFTRLEQRVAKLKTPRDKLRAILLGVWRDIPMENIGMANSLIEALASADPKQKKPAQLLQWAEERLMIMLRDALPGKSGDDAYAVLSNLFLMAYDGFVINRRLNDLRDIERMSDTLCDILLGAGKP